MLSYVPGDPQVGVIIPLGDDTTQTRVPVLAPR